MTIYIPTQYLDVSSFCSEWNPDFYVPTLFPNDISSLSGCAVANKASLHAHPQAPVSKGRPHQRGQTLGKGPQKVTSLHGDLFLKSGGGEILTHFKVDVFLF